MVASAISGRWALHSSAGLCNGGPVIQFQITSVLFGTIGRQICESGFASRVFASRFVCESGFCESGFCESGFCESGLLRVNMWPLLLSRAHCLSSVRFYSLGYGLAANLTPVSAGTADGDLLKTVRTSAENSILGVFKNAKIGRRLMKSCGKGLKQGADTARSSAGAAAVKASAEELVTNIDKYMPTVDNAAPSEDFKQVTDMHLITFENLSSSLSAAVAEELRSKIAKSFMTVSKKMVGVLMLQLLKLCQGTVADNAAGAIFIKNVDSIGLAISCQHDAVSRLLKQSSPAISEVTKYEKLKW